MLGLQLEAELRALSVARALLEKGYLVLPAGECADVVQLVPPVSLSQARFDGFVDALDEVLETVP
jgi:acetylornithine/succinyldiaminopimelate/putrescine aminotransferase